jgi:putative peptidoglycan lipid II flippase
VLDALFYSFGTWGIALSTTIVNIAGTAALLVLLHRRLGRLDLTRTAGAVTRILLACVPLAVVSYGLWRLLHDELGHAVGVQILSLGVALVAGAVVYLAACRVLGVRELQALRLLRRSNTASG